MPTHKEWVVDETGFHAKSVWEPASTDKTVVNLDDDTPKKTDNKKKLRLSEGVFLPGQEGFKFLKECKVKVKVSLPEDMKSASITFKLFSLYNDGKEDIEYDHKHHVSGDTKDGYAEAVIKQLFYDENYANDKDKAPDAKCKYFFRASHKRAEEEKKSEYLEMPQENDSEELYGGFELKKGDNDNKKIWGGKKRDKEGEFVEELQEDLVKLGYWVSAADTTNGMKCDGDFGLKTKGAVVTFQKENSIQETGIVNDLTAKKIKEYSDDKKWERPSHQAGSYGNFLQLKPSEHYRRYLVNYDNNGVMTDNWGLTATMEMLEKAGKKWKDKGKNIFYVGDISKYNGGNFPPHSSHKDGKGTDVWESSYCDIRNSEFNKEDALELAKVFVASGAARVIFNCKYVTDKNDKAIASSNHHHHFHLDMSASYFTSSALHECKYCKKSVYNSCDYSQKATRTDEELTP